MARVDPHGKEFPELLNDCLLRAAKGEQTDFVPVWIMRQAGRYLPEFMEFRLSHRFFETVENPELSCQVTLQPIHRFDLDASIIFSDILTIPKALGLDVDLIEGEGMKFSNLIDAEEPIEHQINQEGVIERLNHVFEAITTTRHALLGKVPLIGFSGGPYTLLSYMVGGSSANSMLSFKRVYYKSNNYLNEIMDMLTNIIIEYLVEQVKAGAQFLQLFESHGEHLTPGIFKEFVYPRLKKITTTVKQRIEELKTDYVPISCFVRGAYHAIKYLNESDNGIDVITIDWLTEPEFARLNGFNKVLQGNLDPMMLMGDADTVKSNTIKMIKAFGTQRYIANLGHGITPECKVDNVEVFISTVHAASKNMNKI